MRKNYAAKRLKKCPFLLDHYKRQRETDPDEIKTEHLGYPIGQDTLYIGYLKGVGRIYQQTAIDTHSSIDWERTHSVFTGPVVN